MHYSWGLQYALCASGIGGSGRKQHIKEGKEGEEGEEGEEVAAMVVGSQRESGDSCTTPSFLQEPQLSGDVSKSSK